uniref:Enoyl reductase (ER) domain-containing protein n=2 Tax=Hemiselmis andersenii TaxID=464988 RepID=A0A6U4PYF8_HEMAN|mmetsp:Transcript_40801/g.99391  ORF Transcript_40801/g.99391 Transcript_40801/m.99391 type:complete len:658 (+) Transcript_40801:53-2026(+)
MLRAPLSRQLLGRFASAAAPVATRAAFARPTFGNRFKTGPSASPTTISDELLGKLGKLSTQALVDGLWVMGWPPAQIEGARSLAKGMKCVGRAVTVRFVPARPDIATDKPGGEISPEYEAFELCGPDSVIVMASVGPWESVGGDIKFLRLMQRQVGGLVTDGSVRDTDTMIGYGIPTFSYSTTAKQGPAAMQPWECNGVISCGGVTVRPGDAIIGDQDGVVVVPAAVAQQVYDIAHSREEIEEIVKTQLETEKCPPGKYYPFMSGKIKADSPLGKLLTSKGVKFYSTSSCPSGHVGAGSLARRALPVGSMGLQRRHMSSVPATMKAAVIEKTGPAETMEVKDWPVPKIADGQVLVKNEYAGINFIDTYHRSGLYARDLPFVGGQEGGGTIAQVTPKAEELGFKVGDKVAYSILQTYAEYAAVPAAKLQPIPDGVGIDVATACVVQGMTAHYLTTDAHAQLIKPGEWMLIHGVGGGTCQWAAQMAKELGYKVIGTTSKGKEAVGRATGVDELIVLDEAPGTSFEDYTSVDVTKKVLEITGGEGVKCVIDGIGKATMDISIDSLARRGIFVSFGNASGAVPPFPVLRLIGKSAFVTRPKLLDYTENRGEMLRRSNQIMGWIKDGKLKVSIDKTFSLDQAADGHKYLEAGKSTGKVLYKI